MSSSALDIRVRIDFLDHPKTIKLQRRAGDLAPLLLWRLWAWARESRPSGLLDGLDDEDIEIVAKWTGETGAFVRALVDCRFLDGSSRSYQLHGWEEHQPWALESQRRVDQSRKAAEARWNRRRGYESPHTPTSSADAGAMLEHQISNAGAMLEHQISNAPDRDQTGTRPGPDRKKESCPPSEDARVSPSGDPPETSPPPKVPDCPYQAIVDLYHEVLPELPCVRVLGEKLKTNLRSRWREAKEHRDLAWWGALFHRVSRSDWLMGRVPGREGRAFKADLEWLTRPSKVEKILNDGYENHQAPPLPTVRKVTAHNAAVFASMPAPPGSGPPLEPKLVDSGPMRNEFLDELAKRGDRR